MILAQPVALLVRLPLFTRAQPPRGAWDIVIWWEARRIPYNLIVGVAGVVSGIVILITGFVTESIVGEPIGLPDPPAFAIIFVILYGVMANVCFTGGWVAELVSRRIWGARAEAFGEVAFTLGTAFSVSLTLLPAMLTVVFGLYSIWVHV